MKKTFLILAAIGPWWTSTSSNVLAASAQAGAALYAMECVSCHGPLESSNKAGATASMIQNAITNNYGGMIFWDSLTVGDVQDIAAALYMYLPTPPPMPAPVPPATFPAPLPTPQPSPVPQTTPQWDGATLYGSYCASCHGLLANSDKLWATGGQIQSAISSNNGGMGYYGFLTSAQITMIATALADGVSSPAPPVNGGIDGASLYAANCSSCHGQLAGSSVSGESASGIRSAINNNDGGMSRLSGLSSTDLEAIASALASGSGGSGGGGDEGDD